MKSMRIFGGLSVAALAFSALAISPTPACAQAQPQFGVEAQVSATGVPGGYSQYSGALPGVSEVSRYASIGPLSFNNGYGWVTGEASASAFASIGRLTAGTSASAERITATAFGNSSPSGYVLTRYWDRITVRSSTLPKGAPVQLRIWNEVQGGHDMTGNYSGMVLAELQVSGGYSTLRRNFNSLYGNTETPAQAVIIKTTVGSTLSVSSRLIVNNTASFYMSGNGFNGSIAGTITSVGHIQPVTPEITIEAASGRSY